jgi:hypothetical protein
MENLNFTQLVLLLLPGFWSLWIYTPFAGYDLEAREWQVKAMMGLGFGVFNLMLLGLLDMYVYKVGMAELRLLLVAALSVVTGVVSGVLAKIELLPTLMWRGKGAAASPYEKGLDYVDAHRNDICECQGPYSLMKVYPVGEEEKAIIGEYISGYGKTGEVILARTPLYKNMNLTSYDNIVVNDPVSNRVFEIYPLSEAGIDRLQQERISAFTPS